MGSGTGEACCSHTCVERTKKYTYGGDIHTGHIHGGDMHMHMKGHTHGGHIRVKEQPEQRNLHMQRTYTKV